MLNLAKSLSTRLQENLGDQEEGFQELREQTRWGMQILPTLFSCDSLVPCTFYKRVVITHPNKEFANEHELIKIASSRNIFCINYNFINLCMNASIES